MLLRSVLVKARKIGQPVELANPPIIGREVRIDFFLLWASSALWFVSSVLVLRIPHPA